jgi:hypothetical protein
LPIKSYIITIEELNDLFSRNIVWVIKSEGLKWAGHVALMGKGEAYTWFWWGNLRKGDHLGDPGVDVSIILRCIFRKWDVQYGVDRAGSE